ncbi:hypothetical protein BH09VER1_BH09VER1_40110 [soil metagenome]
MDATRILLYFSLMTWNQLAAGLRLVGPPTLHVCEKHWRWERPTFVDFDLWVVLAGEGTLLVNHLEVPVSRGLGILFRPGDSVRGSHHPAKPLRVFAAHFTTPAGPWLARRIPHRIHCSDLARLQDLAQRTHLHETTHGWAEVQLAALLADLARAAAAPPLDPVDHHLRHICLEMGAHPAADWTPHRLARQASLSLSQFNKRFRAYTGTSPARYLIERRIDRAKKLLTETPMTITEIADALGYSDVYYFHRQFKVETGQTPGSLRCR